MHLPAGVAGRRAIARLGGQAGRLPFFFYRAGLQRGMLPAAKWEDINLRLDKYLKVSRLIKRRTVANEVCDAKHVLVNGKVARASYEVKVDDELEITMGGNVLRARVKSVNAYATKNDAALMYELLK